mgnify:CR=1 FL=1
MLVAIIAQSRPSNVACISLLIASDDDAVLLMPYVQHWPYFMYGITNFGAFLFKTMISILAFNFCRSYRIAPLLVFSLTRIAFSSTCFSVSSPSRHTKLQLPVHLTYLDCFRWRWVYSL